MRALAGALRRGALPSLNAAGDRRYAEEAGFARFEVLGIENDFYRFYRLRR